ncbi:MAG TPA: hypothetical protein VLV83_02420 [Acidobacteriota bacterium]|nr:hypothetical protein [Acidobacteriota bacterium]
MSQKPPSENPLGEPLTIDEAARLIGCSPWTVRQKHIENGLPYLQSGASGRMTFYSKQVVRWIKQKQTKKGGLKL